MSITTYQSLPVNGLAQALKLLGEPNRLRILCSLGLECRPVTHIIQATGMEQTNVSFHLRLLREAGLVRAERRGPFIYYCLPDPELLNILMELNAWLNRKQGGTGVDVLSANDLCKPGATGLGARDCPPKKKRVSRTSKVSA